MKNYEHVMVELEAAKKYALDAGEMIIAKRAVIRKMVLASAKAAEELAKGDGQ